MRGNIKTAPFKLTPRVGLNPAAHKRREKPVWRARLWNYETGGNDNYARRSRSLCDVNNFSRRLLSSQRAAAWPVQAGNDQKWFSA
jgi:hypothetical protein